MKFAQFQSTYKPLPVDVYQQTGKELEAKYYENRQQSSLLRQGLANAKVEDRNIGNLAKATTDVENMINEVNGKWHYASNVLYNAKDRIVGDKALNASMEDYAKSQATKQKVQDQFEKGDIEQEALNAFYTNDKRYNNKAITLDENGQATNRWATPTPPPKVDTTKKILEINTLLLQHKDDIIAGKTGVGTPLFALYSANPALKGYVDKTTFSGVTEQTLATAAKEWIDSTPEVKQYYNYINDAKVFNAVTEKGKDGKYIQDEVGNFVQKDLIPSDFRDLGIPLTDNWTSLTNSMIIPDIKTGLLKTIPINGLSPNFKDTPLYKQYIESGFSDKEALQKIYSKTLTDLNTDKIIDFAKSFAYTQTNSQTIEDKMFFHNLARQDELDKNKDVFNITPGVSTKVKIPTYDVAQTQTLIGGLIKERDSIPKDTKTNKPTDVNRYNQLDYEIKNLQSRENLLRNSYLKSEEGSRYINELFKQFLDSAKDKLSANTIKDNKQLVVDYLTGQRTDLGIVSNLISIKSTTNKPATNPFNYYTLRPQTTGDFKTSFNNTYSKAIQDQGIETYYDTGILTNDDGLPSKSMEALNSFTQKNASEFNIVNQSNKHGDQRATLAEIIDKDLQDKNILLYDFNMEVPKGKFNDGKFFLRITPKISGAKPVASPLKQDTYVIEPNAIVKPEFMINLGTIGIQNDMTGVGSEWGKQQIANVMYHHYFEDIDNTLKRAELENPNIQLKDLGEQYFVNVPMKDGNYNFKLIPTDINLLLYQLDINGIPKGDPTSFSSLSDVEDSFKEAYFSK